MCPPENKKKLMRLVVMTRISAAVLWALSSINSLASPSLVLECYIYSTVPISTISRFVVVFLFTWKGVLACSQQQEETKENNLYL